VRRDADVDIAVEWTNTFKVGTWAKLPTAQQIGYSRPINSISPGNGLPKPFS
jgi:hypothetical protein